MQLETDRLRLRPLLASDEDDLFAYQSDPDVVRYIPWPVRTREQVRASLGVVTAYDALSDTNEHLVLGIVLKETQAVIGQLNLSITSREHRQGSFGYVVSGAHARRGYAFEASRALLTYAFTSGGLHRVTARIDTRNRASAGVAEKLGMRREGELRDDEFFKGAWTNLWIYGLLETDWAEDASASALRSQPHS
jgi:RimJ/RimL family protein N-acetyltransferase